MRTKLSVVALSVVAAFALSACGQKEEPKPAATPATPIGKPEVVVKLGHVAPMTGPQAHLGKDNENGARLAIEELNAAGMEVGGAKVKFELLAEDDAADPKQGAIVAQKLVDAKVNGVIGHLNSGTTIPASKIYHECGLPMVTGAATNPDLTKPGYKEIFRIIANDSALGAGMARYAKDVLKLKSVAVIDDRTAYGQGLADIFANTAKSLGLQVVERQFTTDKATDFMAILTAIKAKKPEGIFFGGMDPQAGPMQMDQLGMSKTPFMGGDGVCTVKLAELSAGAKSLANAACAEGGTSLQKMPGGMEWKKRYDAKFPNQYQVYSPYTYDATMLLADAMKRADSVDPKVYLAKLAESNFKGITSTIAFESNGEVKNAAITISTYPGGKKTPLQ